MPNALFNATNTLSTAVKYFSIFSFVISLLLKYITLSFPLYLNLNIPYPWLSVVYSKSLIPFNSCKLSILFAMFANPFVSLMFPSLSNMYWLNITPLYTICIYAPPFSSTFISFVVYFVSKALFIASITLSATS